MTQFAAEADAALHHNIPVDDYSTAEACADDRGNRRFLTVDAKNRKMPPQGSGIPVVEVGDRLAQALFQISANVVARPVSVNEIRRAFRAQHSVRARRAGRIQ